MHNGMLRSCFHSSFQFCQTSNKSVVCVIFHLTEAVVCLTDWVYWHCFLPRIIFPGHWWIASLGKQQSVASKEVRDCIQWEELITSNLPFPEEWGCTVSQQPLRPNQLLLNSTDLPQIGQSDIPLNPCDSNTYEHSTHLHTSISLCILCSDIKHHWIIITLFRLNV